MKNSQLEELEQAVKEKRQPICVACNKPLDVIAQAMVTTFYWSWIPEQAVYGKSEELGDSEPAIHVSCGASDGDFVDSGSISKELGLDTFS